jgi:hypothetical protein
MVTGELSQDSGKERAVCVMLHFVSRTKAILTCVIEYKQTCLMIGAGPTTLLLRSKACFFDS